MIIKIIIPFWPGIWYDPVEGNIVTFLHVDFVVSPKIDLLSSFPSGLRGNRVFQSLVRFEEYCI